ncbi:MAG TPA: hypothetical protein ENJ82_05270 [Bacteroidetes bacterium]|nr:hypothetical protein [Bacteroidota bacterium]
MIKLATIREMLSLILLCSLLGMLNAQQIDRLVIGESSDVDKLNPLTNFSATGSYINEYLFSSLLRTDKATGKFVPILAEGLPKISEDELTYNYVLNSAAKFNSGKKITAEDVVFSLKLVKNHLVNNSQKRIHYTAVREAVAGENGNVEIKLRKQSAQGLRITSDFAILSEDFFDPEKKLREISFTELENVNALSAERLASLQLVAARVNAFGTGRKTFNNDATCGPYLLSEWTVNQKIVLVVNKKFWGRKIGKQNMFFAQNVANLEFQVISDPKKIRTSIFQGSVDLFTSLPADLYFELSDIPKLQNSYIFHSPPQNSYDYIGMNMRGEERGRSAVLADVKVRKAMAHLVDVELLLERVRFGLGERIAAEYPSYRPGFRNTDLELVAYDIAKAKELLAQAGWKDGNGNGLLDKEIKGETVEFVLECIYNENTAARALIAEELQKVAREAGVLISVVALPWKEYISRLQKGDFDLAIGAWVSDPNEDTYAQIWHRKNWGGGSNFVGFGDAESDALIEAYDATLDEENRKSISLKVQKKMWDLQPYIFLWVNTHCIVVRKSNEAANIYNYRPGFWLGEWK